MNLLCSLVPLAILCAEDSRPPEDFAIYAERSPFAEVQGRSILEQPRVADSIELYAGADGRDFLRSLEIGTTITLHEGALIFGLCGRDTCEAENAGLALARDGGLIALCAYSRSGDHGAAEGMVRWSGPFLNKSSAYAGEPCPQEPDSFLEAYARARQ